jgi:hypothetical protein
VTRVDALMRALPSVRRAADERRALVDAVFAEREAEFNRDLAAGRTTGAGFSTLGRRVRAEVDAADPEDPAVVAERALFCWAAGDVLLAADQSVRDLLTGELDRSAGLRSALDRHLQAAEPRSVDDLAGLLAMAALLGTQVADRDPRDAMVRARRAEERAAAAGVDVEAAHARVGPALTDEGQGLVTRAHTMPMGPSGSS